LNNPVFFIDPDGMEATPPMNMFSTVMERLKKRLKNLGLIT
jgi:hypothetical protein